MLATQRYARTKVQTAAPDQFLVEILDRIQSQVRAGIEALDEGRRIDATGPLTRASDGLVLLQSAFEATKAPELGAELHDVYTFASLRLTHAALRFDPDAAREAERAIVPVFDGFREAVAAVVGARR